MNIISDLRQYGSFEHIMTLTHNGTESIATPLLFNPSILCSV